MSQPDSTLAPKPMDYGFSSSFEDLSAVEPSRAQPKKSPIAKKPVTKPKSPKAAPKKPAPSTGEADKVAKSLGFASREAQPIVLKKRRRTHHDEPVDQLSIRGPVRILNDFINHCENENLSYWEGLEALLQHQTSSSKKS